jgi:hypothetical protein
MTVAESKRSLFRLAQAASMGCCVGGRYCIGSDGDIAGAGAGGA